MSAPAIHAVRPGMSGACALREVLQLPSFSVSVLQHRRLGVSDSAFGQADHRALLEAADFDGIDEIAPEDLREMCLLVLQEREPREAALLVLRHHLGDRMTKGQLQNLAQELGDDKHWEHYADMSMHEGIFHVSSLLWAAFPSDFPTPDALGLTVRVVPENDAARALLGEGMTEPFLVRLLADGLPPDAMLHRLFEDQLAGTCFPQAASIVWTWSWATDEDGLRVEVTGPQSWLGGLKRGSSWQSRAWPDGDAEPVRTGVRAPS